MARAKRRAFRRQEGVSLLETAATVSLAGVLLAAFVPTFFRHVRLSKVAEAVEQLDALHQGMVAYYKAEQSTGKLRASGCLPENVGPFPLKPSADPQLVDFDAEDTPGREVWNSLGLHGEQTLRYSYEVLVAQPGCPPRSAPATPAVTFRAIGDLDGDGVLSTVERSAAFSPDQRTLVPLGPLHVRNRVE